MGKNVRKRKILSSPIKAKEENNECQQSVTEQDLISKLNSIILLFGNNKMEIDTNKLNVIKSFIEFDKLTKRLKRRKTKKSIINTIVYNWDIIVLLFIIILQAVYLIFFLSSYFSPDSDLSISFFETNKYALKKVSKFWLNLNGIEDETSEECTVSLPSVAHSVLRPVDDCKMCIGLKEIKRFANISKEEFLDKYAYSAVPVIVTGKFHYNFRIFNILTSVKIDLL